MKSLFGILTVFSVCAVTAWAEDLSATFEGDASKRARLSKLQDNATPPALQVAEWMNSEAMTLEQLKGKIVVLDFWATWCPPCIASIPHTNELAKKYEGKVVFIGVCGTRGAETMAETVKSKGIQYPVVKDVENKTNEAYEVNGFPDYYILDQTGKLAVADCANSKVEEAIEALLAKK